MTIERALVIVILVVLIVFLVVYLGNAMGPA